MAGAIESLRALRLLPADLPDLREMGEEMDSPRGRIFLMKEVLEGQLELEAALPYVDRCLGCLACETACPSGVDYGELITAVPRLRRAAARPRAARPRCGARSSCATLPYPAPLPARRRGSAALARPLARVLPAIARRDAAAAARARCPRPRRCPRSSRPQGERRARVALLAGCAQQVLAPDISWATLRVLARNGVEVVDPARRRAAAARWRMHAGARRPGPRASRAATSTPSPTTSTRSSPTPPAAARGCASTGCCSRASPSEARAAARSPRASVDVQRLPRRPRSGRAAAARARRRRSPTTTPATSRMRRASATRRATCCARSATSRSSSPPSGSCAAARPGTYNVEQPDTAAELGARKARNLLATGADAGRHRQHRLPRPRCRRTCARSGTRSRCCTRVQVLDRAYAARAAGGAVGRARRPRRPSATSAATARSSPPTRWRSSRGSTTASARGAASCSPRAASAMRRCGAAGRSTSCPRRATCARPTGASRRPGPTTPTGASRSPARPTASS